MKSRPCRRNEVHAREMPQGEPWHRVWCSRTGTLRCPSDEDIAQTFCRGSRLIFEALSWRFQFYRLNGEGGRRGYPRRNGAGFTGRSKHLRVIGLHRYPDLDWATVDGVREGCSMASLAMRLEPDR